jgi:hypothetical protein
MNLRGALQRHTQASLHLHHERKKKPGSRKLRRAKENLAMADISFPARERKPVTANLARQPDMFGGAVAPSTSILDLAVEMPDACDTCGSRLAVTQSSRGPHFGHYICAGCRAHRRWMSAATYRYRTTIVARFGRPHEPIRITSNSCASTDKPAAAPAPALTTKGHDMNLSEMFPSRFLKAGDLRGTPRVATIASLQLEQFSDGTRKWVMAFVGWPKALPLNKTNAFAVRAPITEIWHHRRMRSKVCACNRIG